MKLRFFGAISLLIWCATVLICGSCGFHNASTQDVSTTKQLTAADYPCQEYDPARVRHINTLFPTKMLKNWTDQSSIEARDQALSGIPDRYLAHLAELHKEYGFTISATPGNGGGVAFYPQYIEVSENVHAIQLVMQHEVGHILQYFVEDHAEDFSFSEDFKASADENFDNPELNRYPRSYGRHNPTYYKEYWAEAFNSFYCAPLTNQLLDGR